MSFVSFRDRLLLIDDDKNGGMRTFSCCIRESRGAEETGCLVPFCCCCCFSSGSALPPWFPIAVAGRGGRVLARGRLLTDWANPLGVGPRFIIDMDDRGRFPGPTLAAKLLVDAWRDDNDELGMCLAEASVLAEDLDCEMGGQRMPVIV
jgi:hypothetical protein